MVRPVPFLTYLTEVAVKRRMVSNRSGRRFDAAVLSTDNMLDCGMLGRYHPGTDGKSLEQEQCPSFGIRRDPWECDVIMITVRSLSLMFLVISRLASTTIGAQAYMEPARR